MSTTTTDPRLPMRPGTTSATFLIGIAGYLGVNLSPYMISALQDAAELEFLAAGWTVTGVLLLTAVVGLSVAPLCAGPRRHMVARTGLALGLAAFGAAALVPAPAVIIAGLLVGGAGVGCAVAASGAAFAAFRDPDRIAGFNGLANRGVITVVLAVIPAIGIAPISVFGSLALFCLIGLALSRWLPKAPTVGSSAAAGVAEAVPMRRGTASSVSPKSADRRLLAAGLVLLVTFTLWAVGEDSLWAMAGAVGEMQAGLTPAGLGLALSGATAGGLLGSIVLMIIGDRLGRAVPLVVLLLVGGALKAATGFVETPTAFIVVFIAWNTVYALSFMYFVAVAAALSADGRWSGPLLATYLVGSSLTPVIGAAILGALGPEGFTITLGIVSVVLAVPTAAVAALSSRINRSAKAAAAGQGAEDNSTGDESAGTADTRDDDARLASQPTA
ncbi:MFS transporter [Zhihengliuella halotolerans]|uniref:MFS transporter n=1 Tax=Zhihengliuella halotolerans TaxID=370736 RepID=UPI000C7FC1DF|nr:MFS transporter [Zhihengliuella halotolerans]